jgi:hypothetical protein
MAEDPVVILKIKWLCRQLGERIILVFNALCPIFWRCQLFVKKGTPQYKRSFLLILSKKERLY